MSESGSQGWSLSGDEECRGIRMSSARGGQILPSSMRSEAEWSARPVLRADSMDEAIALTHTDPAVQAGRLMFELHLWWVKKEVFGGEG